MRTGSPAVRTVKATSGDRAPARVAPRPGQLRSAYGLPTLPRAHPSGGVTFLDHSGGHVSWPLTARVTRR